MKDETQASEQQSLNQGMSQKKVSKQSEQVQCPSAPLEPKDPIIKPTEEAMEALAEALYD